MPDYTGRTPAPDASGAVSLAAASGSRLDVLVATRALIAKALDDGATPRDLAALTRRLSDIDAEVRAIQSDNDPLAEAAAMAPKAWTP